jgi:hypothetical protein
VAGRDAGEAKARGAAGATDLYYAQASAVLDHSRTLPQGNGDAGPTLAGGAIGGERNLIVLDASDVLYDAFAVRRSPAPVLFRLSLHGPRVRVLYFEPIGPDR